MDCKIERKIKEEGFIEKIIYIEQGNEVKPNNKYTGRKRNNLGLFK